MGQKHNKGAEQENQNIKQRNTHTHKNTTVRMLVKKEEKISSSLRRHPWRRHVLCAASYLSRGLSDFDKIWYDGAVQPF